MSILEESNIKKTPISDLGEFGLIELIQNHSTIKIKVQFLEWEMMLLL